MNCTIKVNMDNAAFDDCNGGCVELSRILLRLSQKVEDAPVLFLDSTMPIRDVNGNTVGSIKITGGKAQ